ncbi:MAG: hypothetical protein RIQ93_664 [Verrucomicrobiota bacterium]|jgi:hypothetical protein
MTTPSSTPPAGDDRNLVAVDEKYVAITFEDRLHQFWKKNSSIVVGLCVAVLLVILAKGAWEYMARQKELEIEKAYAAAATPEQIKSFAAAHADHSLAGIAYLRIADDAYTAGKSADALAGYEKAIVVLKDSPLAARAQMGKALAKIQSGKASDGAADLKQLAADANQFKAVRSEAAYHLASLAAQAGDSAEVQKLSDQLMQIEPSSPWTQRALMLRASLPVSKAVGSEPETKSPGASGVQIKIPGK